MVSVVCSKHINLYCGQTTLRLIQISRAHNSKRPGHGWFLGFFCFFSLAVELFLEFNNFASKTGHICIIAVSRCESQRHIPLLYFGYLETDLSIKWYALQGGLIGHLAEVANQATFILVSLELWCLNLFTNSKETLIPRFETGFTSLALGCDH